MTTQIRKIAYYLFLAVLTLALAAVVVLQGPDKAHGQGFADSDIPGTVINLHPEAQTGWPHEVNQEPVYYRFTEPLKITSVMMLRDPNNPSSGAAIWYRDSNGTNASAMDSLSRALAMSDETPPIGEYVCLTYAVISSPFFVTVEGSDEYLRMSRPRDYCGNPLTDVDAALSLLRQKGDSPTLLIS